MVLAVQRQVIRTASTSSLLFSQSLMFFVCSASWTVFGTYYKDKYVQVRPALPHSTTRSSAPPAPPYPALLFPTPHLPRPTLPCSALLGPAHRPAHHLPVPTAPHPCRLRLVVSDKEAVATSAWLALLVLHANRPCTGAQHDRSYIRGAAARALLHLSSTQVTSIFGAANNGETKPAVITIIPRGRAHNNKRCADCTS